MFASMLKRILAVIPVAILALVLIAFVTLVSACTTTKSCPAYSNIENTQTKK